MTKTEFLSQLSKRLTLISNQERQDILDEYSSYIDDKMANGATEEEAVAGFGDIDELAKEILEAYKINTDSFYAKTDKTLDQAFDKVQETLQGVSRLSFRQIVHLIFDAIVILIVLCIARVLVVDICCNLFVYLFLSIGDLYDTVVKKILMRILDIVYLVIAIWFFVITIHRRYLRYRNENVQPGVIDDMKETFNNGSSSDKNQPLYHERRVDHNAGNTLIKIVLCVLAFPTLCALVGLIVVLVFLIIAAITKQVISIGLFLLIIGLVGCVISILMLLMHLWPRKESQDA